MTFGFNKTYRKEKVIENFIPLLFFSRSLLFCH